MKYKRSLQCFQTFQLTTRIMGWDSKWFYIEQTFVREGQVHAVGFVKGLFRGPDGNVPTQVVLSLLEEGIQSPLLPPEIQGL